MAKGKNGTCNIPCVEALFQINRNRDTGADLPLFHTVFTENNADLAVTQQ